MLVRPEKDRRRLRTTNMQERLSEEIRRRERVIRIFPNSDSALRLVGALLAEQNEVWAERRYLDMDEFHEWRAARQSTHTGGHLVALSQRRDVTIGSNLQQRLDLTPPAADQSLSYWRSHFVRKSLKLHMVTRTEPGFIFEEDLGLLVLRHPAAHAPHRACGFVPQAQRKCPWSGSSHLFPDGHIVVHWSAWWLRT